MLLWKNFQDLRDASWFQPREITSGALKLFRSFSAESYKEKCFETRPGKQVNAFSFVLHVAAMTTFPADRMSLALKLYFIIFVFHMKFPCDA
jgi:hypothetical protein